MASAMAPPSARTRMRLTIEVLPLAPDNAHGPHRSRALASFKGRRFALPVSTDDTFEAVWEQIEHRYKTSYLSAQQAACFTIEKLQDAYDCDLFMTDTVASIYEGETDAALRLIKVVPAFANRDFSVPPTTSLRPSHAHKRVRELDQDAVSKRRRTDQSVEAVDLDALSPAHGRPVLSTEHSTHSQRCRSHTHSAHASPRARSRASRSATEASLVLVHGTQTGAAEFAPAIKEESQELGYLLPPHSPTTQHNPTFPQEHRLSPRTSSKTPGGSAQPAADLDRGSEAIGNAAGDVAVSTLDANEDADDEGVQTPERTTQDSDIPRSLLPMSAQRHQTPRPVATRRRDVYDVPSSPEFLSNSRTKPKSTYGRNATIPRSAPALSLLNSSRLRTPVEPVSSSPGRPGSLKKPASSLRSAVNGSNKAAQAPTPDSFDLENHPASALTSSMTIENQAASAQRRQRGRPRKDAVHNAVTCSPTPQKVSGRQRKSSIVKTLSDLTATEGASDSNQPFKAISPAESFVQQFNTGKIGHEHTNVAGSDDSSSDSSDAADDPEDQHVNSAHIPVPGIKPALATSADPLRTGGAAAWDFSALDKHGVTAQTSRTDSSQVASMDAETPKDPPSDPKSKAPTADARSRSVSASPVLQRQPARYLSRSPSTAGSVSDHEEPSAAPPKSGKRASTGSNSSSDHDESSSEGESEADVQQNGLPTAASSQIASSPPTFPSAPVATPSLPVTSQPAVSQEVRKTPIPLPSNIARIGASRSAARYTGFPSLREQLVDAKTPSNSSRTKSYDPRLASLTKLAGKPSGPSADADESSEEDSTSSDSD